MSESSTQWGWRCVGAGCSAKERKPARTEREVMATAEEHSVATGHRVSWGLLVNGRLR